MSVLWELRNALRSGNVWLEKSRRYANPESYLIPPDQWPAIRPEVSRQLETTEDGRERIEDRTTQLSEMLGKVDQQLSETGTVRMENDNLVISPSAAADLPDSVEELQQLITERLPRIELADLLIEVDSWTQFSSQFEHVSGSEPRTKDFSTNLYAGILTQACNFGLSQMAHIADLSYDRLAWCTNWYIRDETLKPTFHRI